MQSLLVDGEASLAGRPQSADRYAVLAYTLLDLARDHHAAVEKIWGSGKVGGLRLTILHLDATDALNLNSVGLLMERIQRHSGKPPVADDVTTMNMLILATAIRLANLGLQVRCYTMHGRGSLAGLIRSVATGVTLFASILPSTIEVWDMKGQRTFPTQVFSTQRSTRTQAISTGVDEQSSNPGNGGPIFDTNIVRQVAERTGQVSTFDSVDEAGVLTLAFAEVSRLSLGEASDSEPWTVARRQIAAGILTVAIGSETVDVAIRIPPQDVAASGLHLNWLGQQDKKVVPGYVDEHHVFHCKSLGLSLASGDGDVRKLARSQSVELFRSS